MSQIPCKQSTRMKMTGWFKHYFPGNLRRNFCLRFVTIPVTKACKKPLCPTRSPVKKRGQRRHCVCACSPENTVNVSAYRWFKHQYPGTFVEPHVQLQDPAR